MSTLVGHALVATVISTTAGASCERRSCRLLTLSAIITAVLPDFDVLVYLALKPMDMVAHRGLSHTILFSLISSSIMTILMSRAIRMRIGRLWFVLFLAAISHLLLDYLMGAGHPIEFLAPFYNHGYLLPFRLLPVAYYGKTLDAYFTASFWILNAIAVTLELIIFTPLILIAKKGYELRRKFLAAEVTISGILITIAVYNKVTL